jgi:RNase P subunit RPR2
MKFQIELLTEDKKTRELCEAYWEIDADGNFSHTLVDLAKRFRVNQNAIINGAKINCRVFFKDMLCKQCQKPAVYVNNRSQAQNIWSNAKTDYYCEECQRVKDEEIKQQAGFQAELEASLSKKDKEEKMREALENGRYHGLNSLELKFLVALASSEDLTAARRKVGLDENNARMLLDRLNRLHLINNGVGTDGWYLLNELKTVLQNPALKPRVKPIFGSPNARDLYRKLKRELPFVYPEIPMCAFIDKEQVEHLFIEDWHYDYFMRARIDFLVCDSEGIPSRAYEYQGSYHQDKGPAQKDAFKKLVLREVGLELKQITNQDLQNFRKI